jgi:hypothetical protein
MPYLPKYVKKGGAIAPAAVSIKMQASDPVKIQKMEDKKEEVDKKEARKQLFKAWTKF